MDSVSSRSGVSEHTGTVHFLDRLTRKIQVNFRIRHAVRARDYFPSEKAALECTHRGDVA
ncbi:hypothetical protein [Streptomyces sp. 900105245]